MSAGTYNFTIEQGASFQQDFTWQISAAPVDVTGYSAKMKVRTTKLTPDPPLANWNTVNGRLTVGTTDGKFSINLRDFDTTAITWLTGVYDIELVSPGATPITTRILQGVITIDPGVTL